MPSTLSWSVLAVAAASTAFGKPLSTSPHYVPSQRSPLALAPLMAADFHPHGTVNNSYIVMLKDDVPASLMQNHMNFLAMAHDSDPLFTEDGLQSGVRHVYDGHSMKGYAGTFTDKVVERIREMPEVDFVERDQIVRTTETQNGAPWGLARISHREKLGFSTFMKYLYNPKGGEGVDVYVIDTGIHVTHVEFEGRASWGNTVPNDDVDEDGNGHGTHCAGTIASRKYGVAKAANVIAVKVLGSNGSGTMSDVVQGVVWAADKAVKKAQEARAEYAATGKTKHKGSVANMSLGGGASRALDTAVNRAVGAGLHFAVAAGNDNRDACDYSPAAAERAVTVGASTLSDERAYFSNYGKCTDVFAPGLNILSTWTGGDHATNTISGTSMASPHTAGLLAYLLSIYPSKEFDPILAADDSYPFLTTQLVESPFNSVYAKARSALPSWISSFLPSPSMMNVIGNVGATEQPTITPEQLKKALLALAGKGYLGDISADTPNLVIFNNATA